MLSLRLSLLPTKEALLKSRLVTFLASGFGSGFFPIAPATFASFVWLAVFLFVPRGEILVNPLFVVCSAIVAVLLSQEAEKIHGRDAHCIVVDEFVGMQVTFLSMQPSLASGIVGFVLFRALDVAKPFPAGRSQRLRGGFGVVADDAIVGAYGRLLLFLMSSVFGWK